jgi:hypothetical protein
MKDRIDFEPLMNGSTHFFNRLPTLKKIRQRGGSMRKEILYWTAPLAVLSQALLLVTA